VSKAKRIPPHSGNGYAGRLVAARAFRGLSRADVAAKARVREAQVWAAERGETPEGLAAICFVLGVSLEGRDRG
jgi:transcriptional regulator with XRE-family HTH domain